MLTPSTPSSPSQAKVNKRQTTEFEDWLSGQSYAAHVSFSFGGLEGQNLEQEPDTFANWIRDHLFLESLDLRGMGIDGEALGKLAKGLSGNRSISCLNFTHNDLGRKNYKEFLHKLADNVSIWRLELQQNHLNAECGRAIADFMRENVGVTHLNLSNNPELGEEGARHILEAFAENGSIYVMKLAGCNCGELMLEKINERCRRNRAAVAYKMENEPPPEAEKKTMNRLGTWTSAEEEDLDEEGGGGKAKEKQKRSIGDVKVGISAADLLPKETIFVLVDQKKREQERLDDATFYEFLAEYLDSLEVDRAKFDRDEKRALENIERDSTAFTAREKEHVQKIKDLEGGIFEISKDMLVCRKRLEEKKREEIQLQDKKYILEGMIGAEEEQFVEQLEQMEFELKDVEADKKMFGTQTSVVLKDLDMIKKENKRLRSHIRKFQESIAEIVAT
ncbi:unnamed protein product [Amoebophrya sp. A120]|nr:unnamed protein product [Amoebophrya sp. A120]|eukprot:GSA120T00006603001.1